MLGFDHRADEVSLKRRAAYVGPDLNFQTWGTISKRFISSAVFIPIGTMPTARN